MPCCSASRSRRPAATVKLQVFASDVDPDAVASAREGLYPETIEADVSPARLARFFSKEDHGYRVLPELRASVVFTVQDVLADPPFSRLDLVSCRNLLIYLRPEAQAKVVSLFHFALARRGHSAARQLRDGRRRRRPLRDHLQAGAALPPHRPQPVGRHSAFRRQLATPRASRTRSQARHTPSRQATLAELCRRLVLETYAPAAVLINRKHECLYFLGPTDRYLRVAPGASYP